MPMISTNRAVHVGYGLSMHSIQGTQTTSIHSAFKLSCNRLLAFVCSRDEHFFNSGGTVTVRFEMRYIMHVLLFCSSRMHSRGANVTGRYDIHYVNTVLDPSHGRGEADSTKFLRAPNMRS